MVLNKWAFFWGLLVYLAVSVYLFLIISSELVFAIFTIFFFIPFSIITLLIILIINIIYKKTNIRPNIAFILLWFLILFQILLMLFLYTPCLNFGVYGGLKGGYFVYEELLGNNGTEYCGTGVSDVSYTLLSQILGLIPIGYILLLVFIIIRAYYLAFKNRNKDELNNKIPTTKVLIGITSLIILTFLILYSLFIISNIESNKDKILKAEPLDLHEIVQDNYLDSGDYNSVAIQKDGKIIVGGNFNTYLGQVANRIIRLNIDGSRDASFNIGKGFDNSLRTIVIQADGKIIVGGTFSTYQGSVANRIIRLNTDGSRDTSFNVGNGFDHKYAYVNTIATQEDGKIIVAGNFGEYKGVSANRIIRLNTDGSRDKTFTSKVSFNSPIYNITIQDDGKILVAGGFERIGKGKMVRLNNNGSLDNSFKFDFGNVKFIAAQSDGKIIVGRRDSNQIPLQLVDDFEYGEIRSRGLGGFNKDGSVDRSFKPQTQFDYEYRVIAIQPNSKILIVGHVIDIFNDIKYTTGLFRLNSDGSKDESFSKGDGFKENVRSIAIQKDGKIVVIGDFDSYQGITAKGVARLNGDGSLDDTFITNK